MSKGDQIILVRTDRPGMDKALEINGKVWLYISIRGDRIDFEIPGASLFYSNSIVKTFSIKIEE